MYSLPCVDMACLVTAGQAVLDELSVRGKVGVHPIVKADLAGLRSSWHAEVCVAWQVCSCCC